MPFVPHRFSALILATAFLMPVPALSGAAPKTKENGSASGTAAADDAANQSAGEGTEGQPPASKSRSERLAAQRFELIKRRVGAAEIRSNEADFPTRFAAKPVFRYSDPARGHVAAAVWKLGDEGRPKALLSTELDRFSNGRPCICHEYISLTTTPFSVVIDGMRWSPASTLYQFKPIPDAPVPERTPQRRLLQIRELAKRFSAHEVEKQEKIELRLLPQPVDRYVPSQAERADGAIFFFTFGTNPEVLLLVESDNERWSYAAGRMTGAEIVALKIDETIAWQGEPLHNVPDSPHTGFVAPIEIPGISADGREVEE